MEEIAKLGERLVEFYRRFGRYFRTKTRDTSEYYGDIPANTQFYLEKPHIVYPLTKRDKPSKTAQIDGTAYEVHALRQNAGLQWQTLRLRANERGNGDAKGEFGWDEFQLVNHACVIVKIDHLSNLTLSK